MTVVQIRPRVTEAGSKESTYRRPLAFGLLRQEVCKLSGMAPPRFVSAFLVKRESL